MRTYKLNYIVLLLLFISAGVSAQTKKHVQSFKTNANVNVNVDAKHTNILVEKWDKNEVLVEAYLDAETSDKKEIDQLMKSWKLDVSGSSNDVRIISGGGVSWDVMPDVSMNMSDLNESMGGLQEMLGPLMENLMPMIQNIAANPLPENFTSKMGNMNFDFEAYEKNPDEYMKKWEAQVEENFGEDFEKDMEAWAAKIEKNSEKWEKDFEAKMEDWEEKFGKNMEVWGEQFGKDMEKWGEQFGKEMEARFEGEDSKTMVLSGDGAKAKKRIRITIPRNAKLNLDVRHGELKLPGTTSNLKASVSHGSLSANTLSGKQTDVKISYSPIKVRQWDYGVLNTDYVQDCVIDRATSIKLSSNSSDVLIREITETGILSGSFGDLNILNLAPGFQNLRITLENSDLKLSLPDTAFSFNYDGTQSDLDYPKSMQLKSTETYDNVILNGFNKSRNGSGTVSIKASFSDVLVK
ncbi:DUF4097 family beta strand repeat-containing protein [Autumnicola psychrophila]|uniref:DUF4097 family beta strand repeat-containing protein n=1 Tax=Autumnicola psychrophila TaxID=3075592 RepID=A0ABU3DT32_9FLAO|nr:DUF4097 family beta strand repeat-containing protein [Zunongwangia sp. F225]MDT0686881.1 DUF4097 family beta strand repeat-containing protein [Zunongwangia sp. F225]